MEATSGSAMRLAVSVQSALTVSTFWMRSSASSKLPILSSNAWPATGLGGKVVLLRPHTATRIQGQFATSGYSKWLEWQGCLKWHDIIWGCILSICQTVASCVMCDAWYIHIREKLFSRGACRTIVWVRPYIYTGIWWVQSTVHRPSTLVSGTLNGDGTGLKMAVLWYTVVYGW